MVCHEKDRDLACKYWNAEEPRARGRWEVPHRILNGPVCDRYSVALAVVPRQRFDRPQKKKSVKHTL